MNTVHARKRGKTGLLVVLPALLVGCDDMLTEQPRTFLSEEAVFQTTEGAISATIGAYKPLHQNDLYGWWLLGMNELFADYIWGRGSQAPPSLFQLDATNIIRIGNIWRGEYRVINRANIVIRALEEAELAGMTPELRDQLRGEARFLRALGYFTLVRHFGDVPLRLEPETDPSRFGIPRTPTETVYDQIIEDLEFAEAHLPAAHDQTELGRATRWAATSLLATVYLWLERWSEAADKARQVIDSGQFSLLEVERPEDFQKMFGPDILTHPEEIFSLKHARSDDQGFGALWLMHRAGSGYSLESNAHAWFGNMDSWLGDWVEQLEGPDLRPNDWLYNGPEDEQWLDSEIPMLFKKFRDTESEFPGNDFPIIRYTEVMLIFAEAESQRNGGPTGEAYEAINMVRRRAHGKPLRTPDAEADLPPGLSAAEFRDELLLERAKEFVMEGKRWYDLVRTGTAIEVIGALGLPIQERHLLWPIPAEEIDNNDALTQADQNPGW